MYPKAIQRLIEAFIRFPTIGPRIASRFAFYVMKASDEEVIELVQAIQDLRQKIKLCSFCFNPYQIIDEDAQNGCVKFAKIKRAIRAYCVL